MNCSNCNNKFTCWDVFKNVNTSLTEEIKCFKCGKVFTLDIKFGVYNRLIGVIVLLLMPNIVLRLLVFLIILFGYPLIIWRFGTLNKSIIDVRSEELQNDINRENHTQTLKQGVHEYT